MDTTRRRLLAATAAGVLAADTASGQEGLPGIPDSPEVGLARVGEGFTSPTGVVFPPGEDRPVVTDQPGRAYRVTESGLETVLDVRDRTITPSGYDERGLLGMAIHPGGDRAFVRYSAPSRAGTPESFDHTFVLAAFEYADGRVREDTERTLLAIPQPQMNHNAGDLAFGPDGYLYVGVGDGGAAGDRGLGHVEGGNGQDVEANLLGSLLRVDVDAGGPGEYAVPTDNPLVGRPGLDEQYAWGFRNPWRLAFDRERLVVADVGQDRYEEVNLVEAGGNYGWSVREGPACFDADDCPTETPAGEPLRDPVLSYPHRRDGQRVGVSVIGGQVYRGSTLELDGRYVFGDWGRETGHLFAADPGDGWSFERLPVAGGLGAHVLAFGRDPAGELYVATSRESTVSGSTGELYRLTTADAGDSVGGRSLPGLGVVAGLAGIGGAAALARRRRPE
jgi:glucose/arabinose dehydrogenase